MLGSMRVQKKRSKKDLVPIPRGQNVCYAVTNKMQGRMVQLIKM